MLPFLAFFAPGPVVVVAVLSVVDNPSVVGGGHFHFEHGDVAPVSGMGAVEGLVSGDTACAARLAVAATRLVAKGTVSVEGGAATGMAPWIIPGWVPAASGTVAVVGNRDDDNRWAMLVYSIK